MFINLQSPNAGGKFKITKLNGKENILRTCVHKNSILNSLKYVKFANLHLAKKMG